MPTAPEATGPEFVITRNFDAPRTRVWQAWTEVEQLKHWWGPKGFALRSCSMDLRPGGLFHYGMQTPNGQDIWGRWILGEIVAPERLTFVVSFSDERGGVTRNPWASDWPLETLSTLTLAEQAGRTVLTLTGVPVNATDDERRAFEAGFASMRQGWTGTLDQLEAHLKMATAAKTQPVIPYLTVRNAAEAIAFYGKAFGAIERMRLPTDDGKRIMHADLALNGGSLYLNDSFSDCGGPSAPADGDKPPVAIVLALPAPEDVDATYRRSLDAGAHGLMAPKDEFWGARFAMLTDPFGHRWVLNAPLQTE